MLPPAKAFHNREALDQRFWGFGADEQIALEHVLTEMAKTAIEIGPERANLSPMPAEGDVLGQIACAIRIP